MERFHEGIAAKDAVSLGGDIELMFAYQCCQPRGDIKRVLPRPCRHTRIAAGQIRLGKLQIQVRISDCLVLGLNNFSGRLAIRGLKADALTCLSINAVKLSSAAPA